MAKILVLVGALLVSLSGVHLLAQDRSAEVPADKVGREEAESARRANVDIFYLSYRNFDEAIALFKDRYAGCSEYARIDLSGRTLVVLRWPVGSRVGMHQYVVLWDYLETEACDILAVVRQVCGEFKFVKKRKALEMVGENGVLLTFPLNKDGELVFADY